MAVFRVEKNRNYTVMSNVHLKDKGISLKAKGLLSVILSLPEDWNYTTRGLAAICKEGVDSIGAALRELESAGYLIRHRLRDKGGRISDTEYIVYESPRTETETETDSPDKVSQDTDEPDTASPCTENPYMVSPDMATPRTDAPDTENPAQLNTQVSNPYESNTQKSNPDPIMIQRQRSQQSDTGVSDMDQIDAREYRRTLAEVKGQIEYDALDTPHDHERLDEIVEIMTETLCSRKPYIKVAGENYPAEVVKSRFKKLSYHHIEYVFLCLDKKHTEVRNIRQYLMTTLYHAPTTMNNYYDAEVRSAGILYPHAKDLLADILPTRHGCEQSTTAHIRRHKVYRNQECYADPTAGEALARIAREEQLHAQAKRMKAIEYRLAWTNPAFFCPADHWRNCIGYQENQQR